jgi:hypothetical protein
MVMAFILLMLKASDGFRQVSAQDAALDRAVSFLYLTVLVGIPLAVASYYRLKDIGYPSHSARKHDARRMPLSKKRQASHTTCKCSPRDPITRRCVSRT